MFQIIPNCKAVSAKLKVLPSSSECDNWSSSCGGSNFLVSELKPISIWFVGSIVFKMDLKSLKFASNYVPADFQVGIWGGTVSYTATNSLFFTCDGACEGTYLRQMPTQPSLRVDTKPGAAALIKVSAYKSSKNLVESMQMYCEQWQTSQNMSLQLHIWS